MNLICMICGQECDVFEDQGDEMWCYCKACDCETFHPYEEESNKP